MCLFRRNDGGILWVRVAWSKGRCGKGEGGKDWGRGRKKGKERIKDGGFLGRVDKGLNEICSGV